MCEAVSWDGSKRTGCTSRFLGVALRREGPRGRGNATVDSMKDVSRKVARFLLDDEGPTAVEYALLLLLVFLAVLSAIVLLGQTTASSFEASGDSIDGSAASGR